MKQKKLIFNFFVNRNWKKLTESRKRAKILAVNRKSHYPIETLIKVRFRFVYFRAKIFPYPESSGKSWPRSSLKSLPISPIICKFLVLPVCKNHWTDQTVRSWLVLACSVGIFFGYANFICSRKCLVESPKERKKLGESKSGGGGEEREKKTAYFFSPSPPPFPSFALSL